MSTNVLSCELLLHADDLDTLEQLVFNGADLNYQAENGWCLLFEFASLDLHKELSHFARKNLNIFNSDTKGRTAIFWAIYHSKVESLKVLLQLGCDANEDAISALPALHYAVYKNNTNIVETLLAHGADIHKEDDLGHTALSYAQVYEREEMIKLLELHGAVKPI
ncbi:MAG: Unknown protein [uncultured Sulfurovum sp.]|uniref:Uncharacterized protein n=1 Tax=uncultured Sulfurovum sp. TaxID=269237 RepID=A0A6S6TRL3_9BACT|nr:MAG: Unknown protein [uncultured Sulfurovum sp.]